MIRAALGLCCGLCVTFRRRIAPIVNYKLYHIRLIYAGSWSSIIRQLLKWQSWSNCAPGSHKLDVLVAHRSDAPSEALTNAQANVLISKK